MKLVREHIKFIRGENPLKALNIGKRAQIDNWFKTWDSNVEYEIDEDLKIHVKGFLNFSYSNITSLLDNLYISGNLYIRCTNITFLPNNLHIGGWLDIRITKITSLPDNLYVGENLYISKTKITLPDDLYVGGKIFKDF